MSNLDRTAWIYECEECCLVFAVEEAYENQSEIACPNCRSGLYLQDVGYGTITVTELEAGEDQ